MRQETTVETIIGVLRFRAGMSLILGLFVPSASLGSSLLFTGAQYTNGLAATSTAIGNQNNDERLDLPGSSRPTARPLSQSGDCNANGISDACDIDCGPPDGPCDIAGCGNGADCNGNGVPDECEMSVCGDGCVMGAEECDDGNADPGDGCDQCINGPIVPKCCGGARQGLDCDLNNAVKTCPWACIGGTRDGLTCSGPDGDPECPYACLGGARHGQECTEQAECPRACIGGNSPTNPLHECSTVTDCVQFGLLAVCGDWGTCADVGRCANPGLACGFCDLLCNCCDGGVRDELKCSGVSADCPLSCVGGARDGEICTANGPADCPRVCGGGLRGGKACDDIIDCPPVCEGGDNPGKHCLSNIDCPAGTCVFGDCLPAEATCQFPNADCVPCPVEPFGGVCGTHNVLQIGFTFAPVDIVVAPGDTIQWHWADGIDTVTSGSSCTPDGRFDQPLDSGNPLVTYVVPVDEPNGVIPYFSAVHCAAGMTGTITVEGIEPVPAVSEWGVVVMLALMMIFGTVAFRNRPA